MKKIIFLLLFLVLVSFAYSAPDVLTNNPPRNASAEGSSLWSYFETFDLINFSNTTAHIIPRLHTATVAPEYLCWDDFEEASFRTCWTTTQSASLSTENVFRGSKSMKGIYAGSDVLVQYNPSLATTGVYFTIEAFHPQNNTASGGGQSAVSTTIHGPGFNYGDIYNFRVGVDENYTFTTQSPTFSTKATKTASQVSDKWDFVELNSEVVFALAQNWTVVSNFSNVWSSTYTDIVKLQATTGGITYADNVRIYNNSPTMNSSASIIAFQTVTFASSFTTVNFVYFGSGSPYLIFSCNNGTPNRLITTNGSSAACGQTSNQLTAWINLTSVTSNVTFVNITVSSTDVPPSITYYNVTSDSGCENWNTEKNNACVTSSVLPSVQFNTDEPAYCSIGGSKDNNLDSNYTDLGSSRNCTGGASGEGTNNHYCTLTDELVYEASYVFISCKDSNGNQNLTSTSGPLRINVSSLENNARNYIGIAVQNALLSGYVNYTDQEVSIKNLSNNYTVGSFDKVAETITKAWAFNRIGISDSNVNMMNLTSVLYTYEFANITTSQITNRVELLINATK